MPHIPTGSPYSKEHSRAQVLGLTPEQIEIMGQRRLKGETYASLAKEFGVITFTATKHIKRWIAKHELDNPLELPKLPPFPVPESPELPAEEFDPAKTQLINNPIPSDEKEQSYRDDLLWACRAAGSKLRTGNRPNSCPNDKAFFLYKLACENPKDFMTKLSQVETKDKNDIEDRAKKKSTQFLLEEIEAQLKILEA